MSSARGRKRLGRNPLTELHSSACRNIQQLLALVLQPNEILSLRAYLREDHRIRLTSLCLLLRRMYLLCRICLLHIIIRSLSHLRRMLPHLLPMLQHLVLFREVSIQIWWCHRMLRMLGLRLRTWSKCPDAKVYPSSTPIDHQTLIGNFY